jgi:hypothetical protein
MMCQAARQLVALRRAQQNRVGKHVVTAVRTLLLGMNFLAARSLTNRTLLLLLLFAVAATAVGGTCTEYLEICFGGISWEAGRAELCATTIIVLRRWCCNCWALLLACDPCAIVEQRLMLGLSWHALHACSCLQ